MASKFAKRAAMRTKYTAPVYRNVLTYASQTMNNWMKQIDPLTQASMSAMTQQNLIGSSIPVDVDLTGVPGINGARGGGFTVDPANGLSGNDGVIVVTPGGGTETVTNCHTHTMTDWTGLGEQYLNGQTSQAIGTPDGHTHLVIAGHVQPVSSILFPNVPVHTHTSLTEI